MSNTKFTRTHEKYLLSQDLKSHMCDFCGYSTSNKSFFDKHVNTHTQETLYSCEKCPFTTHSYRDKLNYGHTIEHLEKRTRLAIFWWLYS